MEGASSIIMLVVLFAVFYFMLIRPENKRKKQLTQMRDNLTIGDEIVTIGGIMGILTDTEKGVFLGGMDTPAISDITSGIVPGVKLTNPDAVATTEYIGTLTDQDIAREAANAYIDQGYDVICASANSAQLGCLWAAEAAGVYAIGFNSDQYEIAPGAVVLSVMRNYTMIYKDVFDKLVAGEWTPGKVAYELSLIHISEPTRPY